MEDLVMLTAIPAFFILILLEVAVGKLQKKKIYRFNDAITNLTIGIGNQVVSALTKGLILFFLVYLGQKWALFNLPANIGVAIATLFFYDFIFYWAHRWSHEINLFWGAHVVHHQSEDYNLAVALRQPWFHHLLQFLMFMPIPLLGVPPEIFLPISLFVTLYQFWIHTRTIDKLPDWVEYIFNTPSHHRVHHGVDPKYIDKNHGAVFIIWDRMFGTFKAEEEEPHYGITQSFESWNPAWANVHYYVELFHLIKQAKNWQDRLKLLFAKPGWRPDYLGGYLAPKEVQPDRTLFETSVSLPAKRYASVQFALCIPGLMAYLYFFSDMGVFFQLAFGLIQIGTLVIIGALLESKRWVTYMEYGRLILLFACLNSLYYINYQHWFKLMLLCSAIGLVVFSIWYAVRIHSLQTQKAAR